jgi:hypothetical protein
MAGHDTQSRPLRFPQLARSIVPMHLRQHAAWIALALVFAATLLPFLVYQTGTWTLGSYARGGAMQFLADFYADLFRGRAGAWTLLLGPATLVILWRLVVAYAWPRSGP